MSLDGLAYKAARQLARALMMSYENGYTFHGGAIKDDGTSIMFRVEKNLIEPNMPIQRFLSPDPATPNNWSTFIEITEPEWSAIESGYSQIGGSGGGGVGTEEPLTVKIRFYKIGTAPEAAGQYYSWAKDSGTPGAWAPGTPGLVGRATNGTQAADAGCLALPTIATTGVVGGMAAQASVLCFPALYDILWVNSGINVASIATQTINSVTLPARDSSGTTDGKHCMVGILVTTATTNAGAILNTTLSYTNQDGVAGRTATMASFPITAVAGTVVWFLLQAGDYGVRSIQSVTLGTLYVAGAISLIIARLIADVACSVANVPYKDTVEQTIYPGTCLVPIGLMNATTATVLNGSIGVRVD